MFAIALLWIRQNPKTVERIAIAIAVLIAAALTYYWIYGRGADSVWRKVDEQNKEAHRASDEAGLTVDQCYGRDGMRWSIPRGKCERIEGSAR